MASGLLVVCLGTTTRLSEYLMRCQKEYRAVVILGASTDTYDAEGTIVETSPSKVPVTIPEHTLDKFRGKLQQSPPVFSAIKKSGQPSYKLARRGKPVYLPSRPIEVSELSVVDYQPPELTITVTCSAGTYIRSLAHDLGHTLGCGGHLKALSRTQSGPFTLRQAHSLHALESGFAAGRHQDYLLPPDAGLQDWPLVHLGQDSARRVLHGNTVPMTNASITGLGLAYGPEGDLIAIVEADPVCGEFRPKKVLASVETHD